MGGAPRRYVARLEADGSVDTGFNADVDAAVYSFALHPDGKVLLGGIFTTVDGQPAARPARLHPDGSRDASFDAYASDTVYALVLQPDGKLLVGGRFSNLGGGVSRGYLGRLSTPAPALQQLIVSPDRSQVSWLRSGAVPDVQRVWFEQSDDAVNYVALGEAQRIPGGWALTLADPLPANQSRWLRARGSSHGNNYMAGSGSVYESLLWFHDHVVHQVTLNPTGNGTATPLSQTLNDGGDADFTLLPDSNHHVASVTGDTCSATDNGDGTWTAHTITADCQVTASFAQNLAEAVQIHAGDGQAAPVLDDFAQALTVRVADAADAPLAGITVSFSTPGSGASAMLSATSVLTDTDGLARITATANGIAGSYLVQARVGGVATPASFALENAPLTATVSLSMSPASPAPGSTVDFTVTVTGEGSLVPGGTVDVLVDGVVVCAAIVLSNGSATCQAGPFANAPHQAWARYPGDAAHAPADSAVTGFQVHAPMPVPVNTPWALAGLVALFGLVGLAGAGMTRRQRRHGLR